jgi:hypothetical protein
MPKYVLVFILVFILYIKSYNVEAYNCSIYLECVHRKVLEWGGAHICSQRALGPKVPKKDGTAWKKRATKEMLHSIQAPIMICVQYIT